MASAPAYPHLYSADDKARVLDHVIEEIATGRALTRILKEDENMPSVAQFFRWLDADDLIGGTMREQVERAREVGAATILDEIVEIADDSATDVYVDFVGEARLPVAKVDGDVIQRAKLRVYAREKYAQMIAPRRYGAKLDLTSGGEKLENKTLNDNRLQALIGIAQERMARGIIPKEKPDDEEAVDPFS